MVFLMERFLTSFDLFYFDFDFFNKSCKGAMVERFQLEISYLLK